MKQDAYKIICEALLVESPYDYAKYMAGQSTPKSRQTKVIQSITDTLAKLNKDAAMFKALSPAQQQALLNKARKIRALKKAGKIGAALALASSLVLTIKQLKKNHSKKKKKQGT